MKTKLFLVAITLSLFSSVIIAAKPLYKYRAYCSTEKKAISTWDFRRKLASQAYNNHKRNNKDHVVYVASEKVK